MNRNKQADGSLSKMAPHHTTGLGGEHTDTHTDVMNKSHVEKPEFKW